MNQDEGERWPTTIWRLADNRWRGCAILGITGIVLQPILLMLVIEGMIGPGERATGSGREYYAENLGLIIFMLSWVALAFVCWMEMIRSGRCAWVWDAVWTVTMILGLMTYCFAVIPIGVGLSQFWVAKKAQFLMKQAVGGF